MNKAQIFADFYEKHKGGPPQGSAEWLAQRLESVGGSERATVLGQNRYKSLRGYVIEKTIPGQQFSGNINTVWGSLLEDLNVGLFERQVGAKSVQLGSLPTPEASQRYSPDLLLYCAYSNVIILGEAKTAMRRVANGRVPPMYMPQVLTGLCATPADYAVFLDATFRACEWSDFNFGPKYRTDIHPSNRLGEPMALFFVAAHRAPGVAAEHASIGHSSATPENIERLMSAMVAGKREGADAGLATYYSAPILDVADVAVEMDRYRSVINAAHRIHVEFIFLKLFRYEIIRVDRWGNGADYVRHRADLINETLANIRFLLTVDEDIRQSVLDDIYPPPEKSRGASTA